MKKDNIVIPEILNANISHKFFYYKITSMNSQHEKTNAKVDLITQKPVKNIRFKDF